MGFCWRGSAEPPCRGLAPLTLYLPLPPSCAQSCIKQHVQCCHSQALHSHNSHALMCCCCLGLSATSLSAKKLQEWACGLLHADHEASDHAMVMLGDNALANQPLGSRQRHTTSPQLLPNMLQQLACVEHSCALGMWQPHPPPRSHLHSSTIWTVAALTFLEITPHFCSITTDAKQNCNIPGPAAEGFEAWTDKQRPITHASTLQLTSVKRHASHTIRQEG